MMDKPFETIVDVERLGEELRFGPSLGGGRGGPSPSVEVDEVRLRLANLLREKGE